MGEERDLVFVSDLHMASGVDGGTGRSSRAECFRDDAAFARFVNDLAERAGTEGRSRRLVLLGDFVDFLHVDPPVDAARVGRFDTSVGATFRRLERIAEGHALVFEALGRFCGAGFPISIVPGNHDVELVRPAVQDRLRELVANAGGGPDAAARISFHPWVYHVPGLVYAEHGSQYHDINAFRSPLAPYRGGDDDDIELPLGSYLTLYLLGVASRIDPDGEGVPSARDVLLAVRRQPSLLHRTVDLDAAFVAAAGASSARRLRRPAPKDALLRAYAGELELPHETVVAIDRLSATAPLSVERRALAELVLAPLTRRVAPRRPRTSRPRPPQRATAYLQEAARAIHRVLEKDGAAVPFYVFGHAHRPKRTTVAGNRAEASYLNTGTWSSLVPPALAPLGGRAQFTFVEIVRDGEDGAPTARLLWWNDAERRAESYAPPPTATAPAPSAV